MSADCCLYVFGGLSVGGLLFGGLSIDCYSVGGLLDNRKKRPRLVVVTLWSSLAQVLLYFNFRELFLDFSN